MIFSFRKKISPNELLLRAGRAADVGDLRASEEWLRRAYAEISKTEDLYHAEIFTRLPLLLQRTGRAQEAWQMLCDLVENGCPGRIARANRAIFWLDRATLFDKMRFFLQREQHHREAILFGCFFYVSRYLSVCFSPGLGKLGPMRAQRALQGLVERLTRKAESPELTLPLVLTLQDILKDEAALKPEDAARQLIALIFPATDARPSQERFAIPAFAPSPHMAALLCAKSSQPKLASAS